MKYGIALLCVLWLAGCAGQPAALGPEARACPAWVYVGSKSYENTQPGMGVGHRYQCPPGWADVFVYDLSRRDWQPGVSDAEFAPHFASTVAEVQMVWGSGGRRVTMDAPEDVVLAGQTFRTIAFRYRDEGQAYVSRTYLTAIQHQLLKFRITFPEDSPLGLETSSHRLVEEVLREHFAPMTASAAP